VELQLVCAEEGETERKRGGKRGGEGGREGEGGRGRETVGETERRDRQSEEENPPNPPPPHTHKMCASVSHEVTKTRA
jgi:hypothetical protein